MLLPVLIISSLVHIYSVSYMSNDPHIQRFFSYLSLFTFMMIILVTADNYLLMFVGWEGYPNSPKWLNLKKYTILNQIRNRSHTKEAGNNNNVNDTSLIIGSLLGNSYLEKNEKGVRIVFIKCNGNIEYLTNFYSHLSKIGWLRLPSDKTKKPILNKVIAKNNKLLYYWRVESYYLTQFDWLYEMFYKDNRKTIPSNLKDYLTPLSLTTWYLDNTDKLYLSSYQSFHLNNENLNYISQVLKDKYDINTYYRLESKGKVVFYIEKNPLSNFIDTVKPYISSSLQCKLNDSHNKLSMWSNLGLPFGAQRYYSTSSAGLIKKNIKYSAIYKKEYILTDIQKEALIGLISSKSYSTLGISLSNEYPLDNLNEYFVTGFTDAEGSFRIRISKSKERKIGWVVEPIFQIGLDWKDLVILHLIQKTFKGVGSITKMGSSNGWMYRISSIKDFNEIIIPHFTKYPLITQKKADYDLLKKVVALINKKEHLTQEGLRSIIAIKASMKLGLSDELKVAFPDVNPEPRPLINQERIQDSNWLAGFINGEGCFFIDIYKSKTTKIGSSVRLKFLIGQHLRDKFLMESLVHYLGCGRVVRPLSYNHVEYVVSNFTDINEKIIPFVYKYPIFGNKVLEFLDFCAASLIIKNKEHLTVEGLKKIKVLKSGMNRGRIF